MDTQNIDVLAINHGSFFTLNGQTDKGMEWLNRELADDTLKLGDSAVIDHRYIDDILEAMTEEGVAWRGVRERNNEPHV